MQGDKTTICEHDIFVFIQELEGTAPTVSNKKVVNKKMQQFDSNKREYDPKLEALINVDFIKKFKNDESSIFTKAFVEDCILIFAEMKKKPKMNKK